MFKNPILLLTYKRPKTTNIILNKILSVKPKKLYIFQDGPKKEFKKYDTFQHRKTFDIISKIKKKNKTTQIIFYSFKKNIGQRFIANKILNIVFKKENEIIFLEDDTFPELSFFNYCSIMLKTYESDDNIYHISGCNQFYGLYKKKINNQKIFLSKYPQLWGWATWKKKWKKFYKPEITDWEKNKKFFLRECMDNKSELRFFDYFITRNSKKKHIGWDIPWIYKLILNNKKTILPDVNLIKNLGYEYDPEGKGAKKFRNLKISNFKKLKFDFQNIKPNIEYDKYLRNSFYQRGRLDILIKNKFKRLIKIYFHDS